MHEAIAHSNELSAFLKLELNDTQREIGLLGGVVDHNCNIVKKTSTDDAAASATFVLLRASYSIDSLRRSHDIPVYDYRYNQDERI